LLKFFIDGYGPELNCMGLWQLGSEQNLNRTGIEQQKNFNFLLRPHIPSCLFKSFIKLQLDKKSKASYNLIYLSYDKYCALIYIIAKKFSLSSTNKPILLDVYTVRN